MYLMLPTFMGKSFSPDYVEDWVILEDINLDNFQDTINLLCSCSLEIESTSHFFCAAKIWFPQDPIS